MTALSALALAALALAVTASSLRYLRVAQREHYLTGAASRFAIRWARLSPATAGLLALAVLGAVGSGFSPGLALLTAAAVAASPVRLGLRGRTSPLRWTRRLVVLAAVGGLLECFAMLDGALVGGLTGSVVAAAAAAVLVPCFVDGACALTAPFERRSAGRFVKEATRRLRAVNPTVVAVTGSYGKTSTKGYVAHLLAGRHTVLASPRSFNNRAGLSRTVNEHLLPGTEVLVAEMGAFGRGEIAALCEWLVPEVAVITAIGPVHLERFGSLEVTLAAKAEITERAQTVVLNVDDERLAALSRRLEEEGKAVVRCSAKDVGADVALLEVSSACAGGRTVELHHGGRRVGQAVLPPCAAGAALTNVACALGAATVLGMTGPELLDRLTGLPQAPNRLTIETSPKGVLVLDDTFNSNPAGARLGLELLAARAGEHPGSRAVLVTPGMVELGPLQHEENAGLAALAAGIVTHLVVVGRTNRSALLAGAGSGKGRADLEVVCVANRAAAVAWVREHLGPGDVVLYENDLPDHFP